MGPSTLTALYLTALALPTSAFPLLAQRQTQPDFSKWAAPGPGVSDAIFRKRYFSCLTHHENTVLVTDLYLGRALPLSW